MLLPPSGLVSPTAAPEWLVPHRRQRPGPMTPSGKTMPLLLRDTEDASSRVESELDLAQAQTLLEKSCSITSSSV